MTRAPFSRPVPGGGALVVRGAISGRGQPALLRSIAGWLRPGGRLVATTGHGAWTGVEENRLGSGAPMWWSHADAATNRAWLTQAGPTVEREEFVPEGDSGHVLFRARRPPAPAEGS